MGKSVYPASIAYCTEVAIEGLSGYQQLWHNFTGHCCQPGRTDLGKTGTLSDRRCTDDGRGVNAIAAYCLELLLEQERLKT